MASPQLENGHTRIANELLERIIASGLNGTELACVFFVLRKTYGFHKQEDEISLSQFQNAIPVSKETICTALSNLQLVKILRLVKKGSSRNSSNLWAFNKDYDTWQLVKKTKLVKISRRTSQDLPLLTSQENLTYKRNYTKENTKEREFFKNNDFTKAWWGFEDMRKKLKKPLTERAKELLLNKLEKEAPTVEVAIAMIEQSIVNSWQGIFPIKQVNSLDQEAIDLVKQYGQEKAYWKFLKTHPPDDLLKVKHIINL